MAQKSSELDQERVGRFQLPQRSTGKLKRSPRIFAAQERREEAQTDFEVVADLMKSIGPCR